KGQSLNPGYEWHNLAQSVTVSCGAGVPLGTYKFLVVADPFGYVPEAVEGNNSKSASTAFRFYQ
ncbi:MAG TPA: hypothetical protein VJW75_02150, partial [Candidatus Eisenbacteria bacterium]|nr:hypothetical protein [Candidatus Eisenbacteria bacterium]